MEKLNSFMFTKILHKDIYDEDGDSLGKLWDIYVTTDDNFPRVIGYKIKRGTEMLDYEFKHVEILSVKGRVRVNAFGEREIIPRTYSYLLSKNLLDKKIVDINGKKLVRVNDLTIANLGGELKVIAVETGIEARLRKYNLEKPYLFVNRLFKKEKESSVILWDNVESIEMVDNNLQLDSTYKKLSKLHPADLADILEDMDRSDRKQVFEKLDEDFAADILEEFEPEIQADILENLSEEKRTEVLESIPNDEIADMLDEVDEEVAEKILLDMEKDDAEEVRNLMKYKEETVGSAMNPDFICFNINITVEETKALLKEIKPDEEVSHYIYIVDEDEKLKGIVSLIDLIVSDEKARLMDIMNTDIIKLNDSDDLDEAMEYATKYNLLIIPVVDSEEKLCGIIIINDLIEDYKLKKKKLKKAI